jgi:anti-sigma regulatory factor (Ser/Thr protein kinase)
MTAAVSARPRVRAFPGSRDQVRHARDFVRRAIAGFPGADDALLLTSELVTNAVVHTASGAGGMFAVTVWRDQDWARIAVRDGGSVTAPVVRPINAAEESGFGLGLVAMLADRWGHDGDAYGRVVWFEMRAG